MKVLNYFELVGRIPFAYAPISSVSGTIQHMVKIQEVLLVPQKIRLTRHSVCQLTILNLFYLMTCSKHFLNRQGAIQGIVGMPALEMSLEAFGIT